MTDPLPPSRPAVLPGELTDLEVEGLDHDEVVEEALVHGSADQAEAEDVVLRECRLRGVALTGASLTRLRAVDVVFEDVELSGAALVEADLTRVEFRGCRAAGLDLSLARLTDVEFADCRLDGANLRLIVGERCTFRRCELTDADLYDARLPGARLLESDLRGANLDRADLTGAWFHGSRLEELRSARGLAGARLDPTQLVPVALGLFDDLGIIVEDEPPE